MTRLVIKVFPAPEPAGSAAGYSLWVATAAFCCVLTIVAMAGEWMRGQAAPPIPQWQLTALHCAMPDAGRIWPPECLAAVGVLPDYPAR